MEKTLVGLTLAVAAGALLVLSSCSEGEAAREATGTASSPLAGPAAWGLAQTLAPRGVGRVEGLALSDDTLLVGVKGAVHVYTRSAGGAWMLQQTLTTTDSYDASPEVYAPSGAFGSSVALDGDTALVGCAYCAAKGAHSGSVYVYVRSAQTWTLQQVLNAEGEAADDVFGFSVALDGETALATSGHGAHAFVRSGDTWSQQATLSLASRGTSVALSGDRAVVISNPQGPLKQPSSSASLFTRSDDAWSAGLELSHNLDEARAVFLADTLVVTTWTYVGFPYENRHSKAIAFSLGGVRSSADAVHAGPLIAASGDDLLLSADGLDQFGGEAREPTNLGPATLYSLPAWQESHDFATIGPATELAMANGVIAFGHSDGSVTVLERYSEPEASCTVNADCTSGHCVEGICCDSACTDNPCQSCSAARKGYGPDGICDWIASATHTTCDTPRCGSYEPYMLEPFSSVQTFECNDRAGCRVINQSCGQYYCDPTSLSCETSCQTDDDCSPQGPDGGHIGQGHCEADPEIRLVDGGFPKTCRCDQGSGTSQCPNGYYANAPEPVGVTSFCRDAMERTDGGRNACIETAVCRMRGAAVYQPPSNNGCGLQ